MLGSRDYNSSLICFYCIQRYMSNVQAYYKLSTLKTDKKCKCLSNFYAVSHRALS